MELVLDMEREATGLLKKCNTMGEREFSVAIEVVNRRLQDQSAIFSRRIESIVTQQWFTESVQIVATKTDNNVVHDGNVSTSSLLARLYPAAISEDASGTGTAVVTQHSAQSSGSNDHLVEISRTGPGGRFTDNTQSRDDDLIGHNDFMNFDEGDGLEMSLESPAHDIPKQTEVPLLNMKTPPADANPQFVPPTQLPADVVPPPPPDPNRRILPPHLLGGFFDGSNRMIKREKCRLVPRPNTGEALSGGAGEKKRNRSVGRKDDSDSITTRSSVSRPAKSFVKMAHPRGHDEAFNDPKNLRYFDSLSQDMRDFLDTEAAKMRTDPTRGTERADVLKHVNMQTEHDNLYFACYTQKNMKCSTISVVQADRYFLWADNRSNEVDVDGGRWFCTSLQPYYVDYAKGTEEARWRYQTHKGSGEKYSKGYYSFNDAARRGGKDGVELVDWSDVISLLKKDAFVYGPFSWKDSDNLRISRDTWVKALPAIIARQTTEGTFFWNGFGDSVLRDSGINQVLIDDCKLESPATAGYAVIPVLYSALPPSRQRLVPRCVRNQAKEMTFPDCSFCFNTNGDHVGAWMELEEKPPEEKQAFKKKSKSGARNK
jgi:hypothetical protein